MNQPIADSDIPEGGERCPMCKGYKELVQAPLDQLPILHATPGQRISCPICYGLGWRILLMLVVIHNKED